MASCCTVLAAGVEGFWCSGRSCDGSVLAAGDGCIFYPWRGDVRWFYILLVSENEESYFHQWSGGPSVAHSRHVHAALCTCHIVRLVALPAEAPEPSQLDQGASDSPAPNITLPPPQRWLLSLLSLGLVTVQNIPGPEIILSKNLCP